VTHAGRFSALGIVALVFVVSMANSLQARVNGAASDAIDHPLIAAMMSVGGGFVLSALIVLTRSSTRSAARRLFTHSRSGTLKPWNYFAGVGGGIFILGQALVVPAYGVTIYIIAVVAGQTAASLVVDRLGIGPAGKQAVTTLRVIAAIIAVAGVAISSFGRADVGSIAVAAVLYGLAAGAATAAQYGLNGTIAKVTESAMVTSALNFAMGFMFLTILLIISTVFLGNPLALPPSLLETPWLWLGGPLGMLFIASAALFVRYLGVLVFTLASVAGQLGGALLLDLFFPTPGTALTVFVVIGLVVTATGVYLSTRRR
jgi:bacterial/archaeal transporter family-2 protein